MAAVSRPRALLVPTMLAVALLGPHGICPDAHAQDARAQERARAAQFGREQENSKETDAIVSAHMRRHNIAGLSIAIVHAGNVVKATGYGFADREKAIRASAETIYNIGSVSKQFIAAAVMMLVQEAKLSLEDPVPLYLKDAPESWSKITIKQLLSHTSGLTRAVPGHSRRSTRPVAYHVRQSYAVPLAHAPGERFLYSNLGYFVLSEIITAATSQSWSQFLEARVFKPAGMNDTAANDRPASRKAVGYRFRSGAQLIEEDWASPRPSGGIQSTVLDLARWDSALRSDRFLTAATRDAMWTPVRLADGSEAAYGLGWRIKTNAGQRTIYHGGDSPGFAAAFARLPDAGWSAIVLANADARQARLNPLAFEILNLYARRPRAR